jgi:hypothetical protein
MNLSGDSVYELKKYFKVPLSDILIVLDDIDMPKGKIRFRLAGSAGTHNGLRDIVNKVGFTPRLRIGIDRDTSIGLADYVLSHIDENADNRCDTCGLTKKATAREVDVTDGEKVAGNWYRIYRPAKPSIEGNFNTVEFQLSNAPVTTWDYSTDLKLMANSLGDNRMGYVYGPGPMGDTLDGMDSVIADEYIDIYLELGTYEIVGLNNQGNGVMVEITEETTISLGDDGAYIKRLDMNYNWVTE